MPSLKVKVLTIAGNRRFLIGAVLMVLSLTVVWWSTLRNPSHRLVDFLRFSRYWTGGFTKIAQAPDFLEKRLQAWGILSFEPGLFEVEPGVLVKLDPNDLVTRRYLSGSWEGEEWRWIAPHLPKGGTFVDVGAHVGTYAIRAARAVGNTGTIVAIEPNPATLDILRNHASQLKYSNITIVPVACGEKPGVLPLFSGPATNTGTTSFSSANAGTENLVAEVEVRKLDDIVKQHELGRLDVLKIDTEGAETMVLRGASETIARFQPVIQVEIVEHQLQNMGSSTDELMELLTAYGYTMKARNRYNGLFIPRRAAERKKSL
jgi:FkbM family methyltransferase